MKIATIFGTRPEIIRLSLIFPLLDKHFEHIMINTQQNFTESLNWIFFKNLKIREPNYNLEVDTSNLGRQISDTVRKSFDILQKERPDMLLVLGDTYSGLSAISASNLGIKIVHMEAGMRCYDWRVPEERNRIVIDHLATINMPYTQYSRENLIRENIQPSKIFVIGNPIVEILNHFKKQINSSMILKKLNLKPKSYILVTAHRSENVDNPITLQRLIMSLNLLKNVFGKRILFPIHPRTLNKLQSKPKGIELFSPLGLFDFVKLEQNAFCVVSDSISFDSKMYWKQSGILKFGTIEKLYKNFNKNDEFEIASIERIKKYGTEKFPSVSTTKLIWAKIVQVWDHGYKDVYKVTLHNGKQIKVTKDHSLFSEEKFNMILKPKTIFDAENFISVDFPINIECNINHEKLEFLKLCGLWIADGSWCGGKKTLSGLCISTGDNKQIISFLKQFNYKYRSKGDIGIYNTKLAKSMKKLGFDGNSYTKRIPEWIFTASDSEVCAVLKGYFSGDGSCHYKNKVTVVEAASVNRKLLEDVQLLLSRLGIKSNIDTGYIPTKFSKLRQFKLNIAYQYDVKIFLDKIGFIKKIPKIIFGNNKSKKHKYLSVRRIRNIEYVGKERVFDLQVNPTESFVANGILCHNSGTVPEECLFYNKPCVTIRKATERTEYIESGSSMLSEIHPDKLVDAVNMMTSSKTNYKWDERLGDGKTSRKVIQILHGEDQ